MTGLCGGQYVEDGVVKCIYVVPWWVLAIIAFVLVASWVWKGIE